MVGWKPTVGSVTLNQKMGLLQCSGHMTAKQRET